MSLIQKTVNLTCLTMAILMFLSLCLSACNKSNEDELHPGAVGGFIVTTDYQTGSFASVSFTSPREVVENIGTICSDAIARYALGYIFLVQRYGCDSIRVLDPRNQFAMVNEYSVGPGTNPQDIAVIDNQKAYVSRLAASTLLVVNPVSGHLIKEIDFSSLADDDGYPELSTMIYLKTQGVVLVAVQRLNNWISVPPSYVAVIVVATDSIVKTIALTSLNPFTKFVYNADLKQAYLGCPGALGEMDGGIEVIDLTTLESLGLCVRESLMNADIVDLEVYSGSRGYALVSDVDSHTKVVPITPETGAIGEAILETEGYYLSNLAINAAGELWILDRTPTAPAIHLYNAIDGKDLETIPLSGLPPYWTSFMTGD